MGQLTLIKENDKEAFGVDWMLRKETKKNEILLNKLSLKGDGFETIKNHWDVKKHE